ncbi:type II toxin-antitoxin system RelE/ParE family toxin [Mesonia mobilis]|uniref:type II toxin-antitoxin system RelE/ParE family toxin n=1 Tax=Mesonia mobilis TaxID=369791 RepID=UPI0026F0D9FB|nr:type II toxin-antitoxin system RelE/ParE family toxin [Mesonia mobilis]
MALTVVWTTQAENGLLAVIDYLEKQWSVNEILQLEINLKEVISFILMLRKALIDKNNYIVYRVNSEKHTIEVINFRGTKQKPL